MTIIFTESERDWLDRRAEKIARERGWPLPVARSEAIAELARMRGKPKAEVVELRPKN